MEKLFLVLVSLAVWGCISSNSKTQISQQENAPLRDLAKESLYKEWPRICASASDENDCLKKSERMLLSQKGGSSYPSTSWIVKDKAKLTDFFKRIVTSMFRTDKFEEILEASPHVGVALVFGDETIMGFVAIDKNRKVFVYDVNLSDFYSLANDRFEKKLWRQETAVYLCDPQSYLFGESSSANEGILRSFKDHVSSYEFCDKLGNRSLFWQ